MHTIDRRSFLAFLGAAALFPSLGFAKLKKASARDRETILILLDQTGKSSGQLLAMNSLGNKWKIYDLPLENTFNGAHSIETSPTDPALLLIFPRKADSAVLFSLRQGKTVKLLKAKPGYNFTGHGLFTPDGNQFLASEVQTNKSGVGFVSVRNTSTGLTVDEINTGAFQPHQMVAMDPNMDTLAISHYGLIFSEVQRDLKSEITFVERKTKTVLQRVKKTTHVNAELCHIVANPHNPGEVFISGHDHILLPNKTMAESPLTATKYFPVPVYSANRTSAELTELPSGGNDDLFVFNFSIAISGKHKTFGVIHVKSGRVSFWDTESKKLRKMLSFPDGVLTAINSTQSGEEFFISLSGKKSKIVYIDAKTLKVTHEMPLPVLGRGGAHMASTSFQV
ncbi:MAG: DUF1513 domain-containing protein [Bdellovibrionota bacterium]